MSGHDLVDSGLCERSSRWPGQWIYVCSCGAGFVAPTPDEAAEGFRNHAVDPAMCEAKDCTDTALTVDKDGAGRSLALCEAHSDDLAGGFPLRVGRSS